MPFEVSRPRHLTDENQSRQGQRGCLPFARAGGQLVFHLISQIYQQTSRHRHHQLTFGERPVVFGDPKSTTALFDRLTRHCDIVEAGNESWRYKKRTWGLTLPIARGGKIRCRSGVRITSRLTALALHLCGSSTCLCAPHAVYPESMPGAQNSPKLP